MRLHTTPNTTKRTAVVATVLLSLVIGVALATAIWHRAAIGHRDGQAARETVEAYLTAVAEGDAETARGYLGEVDDDSLLTDEVLEESRARAPMTDITVGRATKNWLEDGVYDVQVAYTLGEEVSTVMRVEEPTGRLEASNLPRLWLAEFTDVDFTVNGAVPATDEPPVFPGSYLLEASNEYLEIAGGPITAADHDREPNFPSEENELVISEAGIQMFRGKVIAEATACLASTRLDPGCGIHAIPQYPDSVPECEEIGEDSVQRHQDADQAARLETVTPEPDLWEPTIIQPSSGLGRFTVTVSCRTGDTWSSREIADYSQIQGLYFGRPSIDLTDPDLAVVWNR